MDGKDFIRFDDSDRIEGVYIELESDPWVKLALRLGDLMMSGTVGKMIGPGSAGTTSGESRRASVDDLWYIKDAKASKVGSNWSSAANGLSLGLSAISAMRRLEGDPERPAMPFVLILLMLVCRECLIVVADRFNKSC